MHYCCGRRVLRAQQGYPWPWLSDLDLLSLSRGGGARILRAMKNELDVVRKVSARLDRADVAYMLTGFMAPGSRARKTSSFRSSYALGIRIQNCSFTTSETSSPPNAIPVTSNAGQESSEWMSSGANACHDGHPAGDHRHGAPAPHST